MNTQEYREYEIISCIGRGGTGTVYLVQDKYGIKFAIKEIDLGQIFSKKNDIKNYVDNLDHIVHELSRIEVPDIPRIYDIIFEKEKIEIAYEYIEGMTLLSYVQMSGKVPVDEVVTFFIPLVNTINILHMHHIVANDIKPDNIIINNSGNAILIDIDSFAVEGDKNRLISKWYSAPEKIKDGFIIKKEVDYYSLGACMYYSLTGKRPPFAFDISNESNKDDINELDAIKDVPSRLKHIVFQMMDKDINQRASDYEYIINELTSIMEEYCRDKKRERGTDYSFLYFSLIIILVIVQALLIFLCIKVL